MMPKKVVVELEWFVGGGGMKINGGQIKEVAIMEKMTEQFQTLWLCEGISVLDETPFKTIAKLGA